MSYERITKHNSPNFTPKSRVYQVFGVPRVITSITIHHWGDPATSPTFSGVINWLCRKNGSSSAHAVIEAGRVAYLINYSNASWSTGNKLGNATTIGLELHPRASDADYETAGEHIADIWMEYGLLPLRAHKQWKATECPGKWNLDRLTDVASRYYGKKKNAQNIKDKIPAGPIWHTVKKNETLYGIARKYKISLPQLLSYNNVKPPYTIHPGEKYRVRKN